MLVAVAFNKTDKNFYTYIVDSKQKFNIKKGDWVVVMAGQYKVVQVKEIFDKPTDEQLVLATKFIVDIVDTIPHKIRVKEARDEA